MRITIKSCPGTKGGVGELCAAYRLLLLIALKTNKINQWLSWQELMSLYCTC
jgi:hypothetical protein